jgi:hypothetical protein
MNQSPLKARRSTIYRFLTCIKMYIVYLSGLNFEYTKGVIRSRISKTNRKYNGQKEPVDTNGRFHLWTESWTEI